MIGLTLRHPSGWWLAACCGLVTSAIVLYAVALVGLIVIEQWSDGRALFPTERLTVGGSIPDGCVVEDDYVVAATGYVPVAVLSCWDRAGNLRVVSPESAR